MTMKQRFELNNSSSKPKPSESPLKKLTKELKETAKAERVNVYIRVRPFTYQENENQRKPCIDHFDTISKTITVRKELDQKSFSFDDLFDGKSDQRSVYQTVAKPVIDSVLDGYNGTIFAYGQTGSGKTYTILGEYDDEKKKGIIPRALQQILDYAVNDRSTEYEIELGYLQIYMEMMQDLIEPNNTEVKIRESIQNGVFIEGLTWIPIKNVQESIKIISDAEKNRITAFTRLNAESSRSHSVLMIRIIKRGSNLPSKSRDDSSINSKEPVQVVIHSVLYLVDLAGSERIKKSKATGERLDEAISINSSLTALGKCIHALADNKRGHVPFRESKLTRILQESLGGNSKTALIVNIGPSAAHLEETISSLLFGSRAMKVQNKPYINKQTDYYELTVELQALLDGKNEEIGKMHLRIHEINRELESVKKEKETLQLTNLQMETMNTDMRASLTQKGSKETFESWEKNKRLEIQRIEHFYKEKLRLQEEDHKSMLDEIDKVLLDQENEIVELKRKNEELIQKLRLLERDNAILQAELTTEREEKQMFAQSLTDGSRSDSMIGANESKILKKEDIDDKKIIKELEEKLLDYEGLIKVYEDEKLHFEMQQHETERRFRLENDLLMTEIEERNLIILSLKNKGGKKSVVIDDEQLQTNDASMEQKSSVIKKNSKESEKGAVEGEAGEIREEQDIKRKYSGTESEKSRIEVSLADLKHKITKITQENERLTKIISELEIENEELKINTKSYEEESGLLKTQLEDARTKTAELNKNLEIMNDLKIEYETNLSEKEELQSKLEDLEKNIELYKEQVAKLEEQYKDKEKAFQELKRANDEISSRENLDADPQLQQKYEEEKEVNQNLRQEIAELNKQLEEKKDSHTKLFSETQILNQKIQDYRKTLEDRTEKLQNADQELQALTKSLQEHQHMSLDLVHQIEELSKNTLSEPDDRLAEDIKELEKINEELAAEVEAQKEINRNLEAESQELSKLLEEERKLNQTLESEITELSNILQEKVDNHDDLTAKYQELEKITDKVKAASEKLREENQRLLEEVENKTNQKESFEYENNELRTKLEKAEAETQSLAAEISDLSKKLEEESVKNADLQQEIQQLTKSDGLAKSSQSSHQSEAHELLEQISKQQLEIDNLNTKIEDQSTEINSLISINNEQKVELAKLREDFQQSKAEVKNLNQIVENQNNKIVEFENFKQEKEKQIESLEAEVEKAFEQFTQNELEYEAEMKKKTKQHQTQVSQLQAKINELEEVQEEERDNFEAEIEKLKVKLAQANSSRFSSATKHEEPTPEKVIQKTLISSVERGSHSSSVYAGGIVPFTRKDSDGDVVAFSYKSGSQTNIEFNNEQEVQQLIKEMKQKLKSSQYILRSKENEIKNMDRKNHEHLREISDLNKRAGELKASLRRYESTIERMKQNQKESTSYDYSGLVKGLEENLTREQLSKQIHELKELLGKQEKQLEVTAKEIKVLNSTKLKKQYEFAAKIDHLSAEICEMTVDKLILHLELNQQRNENELVQKVSKKIQKVSLSDATSASREWLNILTHTQQEGEGTASFQKFVSILNLPSMKFKNYNEDAFTRYFTGLLAVPENHLSWNPSEILLEKAQNQSGSKQRLERQKFLANIQEDFMKWLRRKNVLKGFSFQTEAEIISSAPISQIYMARYRERDRSQFNAESEDRKKNYIECNTNVLHKVLQINKGFQDQLFSHKDLVIRLSEIFITSYNASLFLSYKWKQSQKIIEDLHHLIEMILTRIFKNELTLYQNERVGKTFEQADDKNTEIFVKSLLPVLEEEEAAIKIQRFLRKKNAEISEIEWKVRNEMKDDESDNDSERKNSTTGWDHHTGKLIVNQANEGIEDLMRGLLERFTANLSLNDYSIDNNEDNSDNGAPNGKESATNNLPPANYNSLYNSWDAK